MFFLLLSFLLTNSSPSLRAWGSQFPLGKVVQALLAVHTLSWRREGKRKREREEGNGKKKRILPNSIGEVLLHHSTNHLSLVAFRLSSGLLPLLVTCWTALGWVEWRSPLRKVGSLHLVPWKSLEHHRLPQEAKDESEETRDEQGFLGCKDENFLGNLFPSRWMFLLQWVLASF